VSTCFLGVDVGGTFTDLVLAEAEGRIVTHKVVTAPDPLAGVVRGIRELLQQTGRRGAEVVRLVHGTTLATNVVLERRGSRVALVTTEGFGDLLRLGREARVEDERYDLFFGVAEPPVPRRLTFETPERVTADGTVLRALTDDAADATAMAVAAAAPGAVAVCLLHSYAHPDHERRLGAAMRRALPAAFVAVSSEVWPELREYDRAMTTTLCAYVGPVMAGYLARFGAELAALGIDAPVEVMDSAGGVMSAERAATLPVATIESGGAAGVMAAALVGRWLDDGAVVSFDMGGTTAKAGVVRGGTPDVTYDFQVGGRGSFGSRRSGSGLPVKLPVVDMAEVGAGGGSIAWVDAGGAVRVGPRSAGASPGPACYGWGGTEPTVTDADLVLGHLAADRLAGGVHLQADLAVEALTRAIGDPLGVDVASAARLVHDVVNVNMAAAIRVVTIQRGIDPRDFTLVAFGGAGPVHAVRLAQTFGVARVAVPRAAGVGSALGLLSTDPSVERVRTRPTDLVGARPDDVEAVFAALEDDAARALSIGPGVEHRVARFADLRWAGQAHQLTVALPDGPVTATTLEQLPDRFAEAYRRAYGIDGSGEVQLVTARVRTTRVVDKLAPRPSTVDAVASDPLAAGQRDVWFVEVGDFTTTDVYDASGLQPGDRLTGPAVVEAPDTTIVVPPGCVATVDGWGTVVVDART
jgi:N-methylhydantoinase A